MSTIQITWQAQPRAGVLKQGKFTFGNNTYYVECKSNHLVTISRRVNEDRALLDGERVKLGGIGSLIHDYDCEDYLNTGPMKLLAAKKGNLTADSIQSFLKCDEAEGSALEEELKK